MTFPAYGPPSSGPQRRRRAVTPALGIAMVVIVGLLIAVSVIGYLTVRDRVDSPGDVSVGECVSVSEKGGDDVSVRSADCGRAEVTYYVAATTETTAIADCPPGAYDAVTLGDDGALCLAPNLREGQCYEIGRRSAFSDRACTAVAASTRTIVEVARRVEGDVTPRCPSGAQSLGFTLPRPIGYCLTPPSGVPA